MIVLHAGFAADRLRLWGEAKPDSEPGPTPAKGRKPRGRKALETAPYPFDAGREGLAAALARTPAELALPAKTMETWTAWLPTRGGQPVASSSLVAAPPSSRAKTEIAPWMVTARPLTSAEAVDFLSLCADRHLLAAGVVVGSDLAFWAAALRFAGSLVARQQFLPGLAQNNGAPRAEWQPIFVGRDAEELARLSRRLPPAARALSVPDTDKPNADTAPETAASEVVKAFLTQAVDRLARLGTIRTGERAGKRRRTRGVPAFPSFHDAWLQALRDDDGAFAVKPNELSDLKAQVDAWRRPIALAAASPFRLSFRLEEPPDGESSAAPWQVRYLLQPHDDRSLLVPVGELWRDRGAPAELARRLGSRVRESTLSALGQAASICPRIAASLGTAAPDGYETDTAGAHEFLTETALALEQAGFGVLLPAWWTRKGTKLRLAARAKVRSPRMQGGAGLSLQDVVQFRWEVALGDKALTAAELEALAKLKTPLVRIRGQWVEMSAGEIQAAIEFWRQRGEGTEASVRDVVRMALGGEAPAAGLEVEGVKASGWIKTLLDELDDPAKIGKLQAPAGFAGVLRPYQARGYAWLAFLRRWGLGACLADDMGLGKTVQTLVLVQRDWQEAEEKKPVLLVCPTSVINNWQKEAARFTPELPVAVHHGAGRKKKAAFKKQARGHALVLTSYALLHRDADSLRAVDWAGVVLDEAQNVKNPETLQARAARSLPAEYRIALTGTPVENNVGDLWSIMEFLNPGFLGTRAHFKRAFFVPIQAERDPEAARRLKRLTGPFVLRREKTDKSIISDLPEKQEMKVFCNLTSEQASLYRAVVKEVDAALEEADGMKRRGLVLATLSKLKQVCNHPAQFLGDNSSVPGRSGKLARLTEMLEEVLEVGERALVFSQFAEMGALLERHLEETFGREVLFLHGGVPKARRDKMVDRFQSDGGPPILLLSLKAGGTGLNLTRASHVFHYDRWWNPAVEDQATDRAFRIGQERRVQVHKFLCAGTVEEKIDEMIERKKKVAREVVGTGEAWLTELSNAELRDVFALRKEAVKD